MQQIPQLNDIPFDTDDATAFRGLRPVAATPAAVAWAAAVVAAGGVGAAIGDAVD
ncbi:MULTISPECIES: hypothetical protein [Curtobacterium]|uniref:hypothetical protein n=1 Tax=Curtobacterium TaxID=2034 RepID=UPI0015E8B293|nr:MULTISPECIES: hypothetical protein [Curtobacterium]MBO9049291.1 hypothetical protein [Curtobacterium flaccumfaciens pv. flaccumfaciens]WIE58279.1 hypothetical protein DEI96_001305 [Curtobacterium sp. MCLR17_031]WIE83504.1 hypothetical protein DEJ29_001315 [Curtobacterium sp. MCPF17_021]